MAAPIEHRCPSCDTLVATHRPRRVGLGPPFLECPQCKSFVKNEPFEEWSSMRPGTRLTLVASGFAFALSLGILPVLACALADVITRERTGTRTLLLLAGCGLLVSLSIWGTGLSQRIRGSRRRMTDPMYRAKLVRYQMGTPPAASRS